jgi:hypothetical protein
MAITKQARLSQRTRLLTKRNSAYMMATDGWLEGFIMKQ